MKRSSALLLQTLVALIGLGVLAFLIWEPAVEGVNAQATTFAQIYLDDPFLAFAYLSSIPFFLGLYKIFKVLGYAGENAFFSEPAAKALKTIRYCALINLVSIWGGVAFLMTQESDDRPPIFAMATIASLIAIAVAAAATKLGRRYLQPHQPEGQR